MKLYELTNAFAGVLADVETANGELGPHLEERLDAATRDLSAKVNGVCSLVRQMEAEASVAGMEAARLANLAKVRQNAAKRLKAYLLRCLSESGLQRHETDLFRVRVQANPPSYVFTGNPETLPRWARIEKYELNREAVKMEVARGIPLPDGVRVEQSTHLRIT